MARPKRVIVLPHNQETQHYNACSQGYLKYHCTLNTDTPHAEPISQKMILCSFSSTLHIPRNHVLDELSDACNFADNFMLAFSIYRQCFTPNYELRTNVVKLEQSYSAD